MADTKEKAKRPRTRPPKKGGGAPAGGKEKKEKGGAAGAVDPAPKAARGHAPAAGVLPGDGPAEARQGVRAHQPAPGAAAREDRAQRGHGRREQEPEAARRRRSRSWRRSPARRPVVTRAKKAIANFGLREGMPIGAVGDAARRRGCTSSSTGSSRSRCRASATSAGCRPGASTAGATTRFGIKEQMIFPEIDYDKVEKIHGMDITLVTSTDRDDLAHGAAAGAGHAVPGRDAAGA